MSNDLRTFEAVIQNVHRVPVTLGFYYTGWALALAKPANEASNNPLEQAPITTTLSTVSHELPFPPPNPATGRPVFCMKTYSENEGILTQLVRLGVVEKMNTVELQNGPLVEVLLEDTQIAHACLKCVREYGPLGMSKPFELPGEPRLSRCSKCKVARYCNTECQKEDWEMHKQSCKLWRTRPAEAARLMENRRRADVSSFLDSSGFQTITLSENMRQ
ncbi:hypothetical protein EV122DRAFT_282100 [Schizophyllum commune]